MSTQTWISRHWTIGRGGVQGLPQLRPGLAQRRASTPRPGHSAPGPRRSEAGTEAAAKPCPAAARGPLCLSAGLCAALLPRGPFADPHLLYPRVAADPQVTQACWAGFGGGGERRSSRDPLCPCVCPESRCPCRQIPAPGARNRTARPSASLCFKPLEPGALVEPERTEVADN